MDSNQEDFLIRWNYEFPADRWYRKKYNIGFHSPAHLELCQIDIALEYYEERLFDRFVQEGEMAVLRDKQYAQGELIFNDPKKQEITEQQEQDLFAKIKPDQFSKIKFTNDEE